MCGCDYDVYEMVDYRLQLMLILSGKVPQYPLPMGGSAQFLVFPETMGPLSCPWSQMNKVAYKFWMEVSPGKKKTVMGSRGSR